MTFVLSKSDLDNDKILLVRRFTEYSCMIITDHTFI